MFRYISLIAGIVAVQSALFGEKTIERMQFRKLPLLVESNQIEIILPAGVASWRLGILAATGTKTPSAFVFDGESVEVCPGCGIMAMRKLKDISPAAEAGRALDLSKVSAAGVLSVLVTLPEGTEVTVRRNREVAYKGKVTGSGGVVENGAQVSSKLPIGAVFISGYVQP